MLHQKPFFIFYDSLCSLKTCVRTTHVVLRCSHPHSALCKNNTRWVVLPRVLRVCNSKPLFFKPFCSITVFRAKYLHSGNCEACWSFHAYLASCMVSTLWLKMSVIWPIRGLCCRCWSFKQIANLDSAGICSLCKKGEILTLEVFNTAAQKSQKYKHGAGFWNQNIVSKNINKRQVKAHLSNRSHASMTSCWTRESWGSTLSLGEMEHIAVLQQHIKLNRRNQYCSYIELITQYKIYLQTKAVINIKAFVTLNVTWKWYTLVQHYFRNGLLTLKPLR